MRPLRFPHVELPDRAETLRRDVRAFLHEALAGRSPEERALSWTAFDADFSREMGRRGFLGLTLPSEYGGRGAGQLERYVVLEETLAAGAPVAAHWIGDRQSGPLILRFGTEAQKQQFLPRIARGEAYFCIGMSEPDTGSDLASVRTVAERVSGGFRVRGTKLWSTHATRCQHMIALVRTSPMAGKKHEGLSQLLVDLHGPGITVRPIYDLAGHDHFGEIVFDDAFVPEDRLIGSEGQGFRQVMAELALERSGPERILSSVVLIEQLIANADDTQAADVGMLLARLRTLRHMSLSVAARLERGEDVSLEAALVKELGTSFEQDVPEVVHRLLGTLPMRSGGDAFARAHGVLTQIAPSFSLRGGTREFLRGIIAKELLR